LDKTFFSYLSSFLPDKIIVNGKGSVVKNQLFYLIIRKNRDDFIGSTVRYEPIFQSKENIVWQLNEEEKNELRLDWLGESLKKSDYIIDDYYQNNKHQE
jgi:hypothetical protein